MTLPKVRSDFTLVSRNVFALIVGVVVEHKPFAHELLDMAGITVVRSKLDRLFDPSSVACLLFQSAQSKTPLQRHMGPRNRIEQRYESCGSV